ncbi:MAG: glycosyltransferase, partial [Miltoncostaeaceae bacterium]
MRHRLARAGFWAGAAVIVHTLVGLPAALVVRAALRPRPVAGPADASEALPHVTVVLAAHQEVAVIAEKVRNTFALDHPAASIDLVLVCDGCTDGTASAARAAMPAGDGRLSVIEVPRGGKNAALRAGIAAARGEVLLFTDADAMLAPDALAHLLGPLRDPAVGGSAGRVSFAIDGEVAGEHGYWAAEDALRRLQTRGGSLTSAAGPVYLVRRGFAHPPPDGVTDDFWISVQVPVGGRRLVFVPDAAAHLPPP